MKIVPLSSGPVKEMLLTMPNITLNYTVTMPEPTTHHFDVTLSLKGEIPPEFVMRLPAWTPGSYLIREFAKHVGDVRVHLPQHAEAYICTKLTKDTWSVHCPPGTRELILTYSVYAYELTVRTSYLDALHGYFNGANLFLYRQEWQSLPCTMEIVPPPGWDVACGLPQVQKAAGYCFVAENYDTLVDSPVEVGPFQRITFEALGIPHDLVVFGKPEELDTERLLPDLKKIIQTTAAIFDNALPYAYYVFIVHVTESSGGGLEHRNSSSIDIPRFQSHTPDGYRRLLGLFAHEYFHLWNVKRLRPLNLGPFDYQSEVYTPLLWALEGITDYYAPLIVARSNILPVEATLTSWADALSKLFTLPARHTVSLEASSRDAWIKFYRSDSNTPNSTVSYYQKGALAGLFIDLAIREATDQQKSLDTVMGLLWGRYADHGYPTEAFEATIVEVGGESLRPILDRYVRGTQWFDESALAHVGLRLIRDTKSSETPPMGTTGIVLRAKTEPPIIQSVLAHSPAERAGLSPDDVLIAANGYRVSQDNWPLFTTQLGTRLRIHAFHQGILTSLDLDVLDPEPDWWHFGSTEAPDANTQSRFTKWIGRPYPFLKS